MVMFWRSFRFHSNKIHYRNHLYKDSSTKVTNGISFFLLLFQQLGFLSVLITNLESKSASVTSLALNLQETVF